MKALLMSMTMGFGLLVAAGVNAQAPATAPAGSTGLCKDGSYSSGASKKGACRGHKGVKEWYGAGSAAATEGTAVAPKTKKSGKSKAADETAAAPGAATAAAPAGSTGQCKDGSYTSGASKRGACRGHKGVKEWYGATAAGSATTMASPKSAPASATATATATAGAPSAAPAAAPAGSTGLCKDGTYYAGASKRGTCRGHKGVKEWYGAAAAGAGTAAAMPARNGSSMPMTPPAAAPAPTAAPVPAPTRAPAASSPETRAAVPGGGNGQVWVNTETKVYHCQGDRYYGKTKQGEYLSESAAIAAGNRASHGKSCAQ